MMDLAKVWPLRPGLMGTTPDGHAVSLAPGVAGFMEYAEAVSAQARGEVQLMAGQTPGSLREPVYETRQATAEEPRRKLPNADMLQVPKSPPARKKRAYSRRDIQAEKAGT